MIDVKFIIAGIILTVLAIIGAVYACNKSDENVKAYCESRGLKYANDVIVRGKYSAPIRFCVDEQGRMYWPIDPR